jgi:YD repeat-containing protein
MISTRTDYPQAFKRSKETSRWRIFQAESGRFIFCFALLSYLLGAIQNSFAQGSVPNGVPTIIPPAPTAAALEKYGQVPVSTYTGVPNITLPLYEIKVRDLSIPINLSYHAGGFRVSEEASWVGLGWSLLAGGAITRTVRNLDDLTYFILSNNTHYPFAMPDPSASPEGTIGNGFNMGSLYTGLYSIVHNCQWLYVNNEIDTKGLCGSVCGPSLDPSSDWEPDDFRFTMGSHSGQFAFKQDGSIHMLGQQKVKIIPPTRNQPQSGWQIITSDGYQYFFSAKEESYSITPVIQQQSVTSAWYLTRILTPLGEEATFVYEAGPKIYSQPMLTERESLQMFNSGTGGNCAYTPRYSGSMPYNSYTPQYIKRINFKTGYVLFDRETSTERSDLRGGQRLTGVKVYTAEDELLKAYDLQTSYFTTPISGATGPGFLPANDPGKPYEDKRLRLDAVVEKGAGGTVKPPTTFRYNSTPLPIKSSYSVDFWGYFNGLVNSTLLPECSWTASDGSSQYSAGADRRPDPTAMKACILEKITYPTGGSTMFTFEPHDYGNVDGSDYNDSETTIIDSYFSQDNLDPTYNVAAAPFTITYSSPLRLYYTLTAESRYGLDHTALLLIDDITGATVKSWGAPASQGTSAPFVCINLVQTVLRPGRYRLAAQLEPNCSTGSNTTSCHGRVQVRATLNQRAAPTAASTLLAGGLRVQRIEDYDGIDAAHNQVKVYQYRTPGFSPTGQPVSFSNGVLVARPVFTKLARHMEGSVESSPYVSSYYPRYNECLSFERLSYSQSHFSVSAQGNTVGYVRVAVLNGAQGEGGKTEFFYHCTPDREPSYNDRLPNIPLPADELNGQLLTQITYRKTNSNFEKVTEIENTYEVVNRDMIPGMHRGAWDAIPSGKGYPIYNQPFYYYTLRSQWVRLAQTTNKQYDPQDAGKFLTTSTSYKYDVQNVGHMQVSQTETRQSNGSVVLKTSTYPADYLASMSATLASMQSDAFFQHSAVVESITQVYQASQTSSDAKTIAGSYTEYGQPASTAKFVPVTQQTLDLTQPTAAFSTAAPNLPPAGRYMPKVQLSYEPTSANLQQAQRIQDVPTTYVWGYQNTLPLASVQNATASQVQNALTALGTSLATLATVTDEQQLRSTFAQLRQQLPQARITSLTYQPLVGVTTQTRPDGRLLRYEYDGFQRLLRVRDEQGRILTQQEYKYGL